MDNLKIVSINVNGLNIPSKRRVIFDILRRSGAAFCLLQETHGTDISNHLWQKEWGGSAYFSNGTQSSRGVAILVSRKMSNLSPKISTDDNGRIICMDVEIEHTTYTLGSFYAPTQDRPADQVSALDDLEHILENSNASNYIIAGDFNCFMNPSLDRNSHSTSAAHSEVVRDRVRLFLDDWDLCDLWRIRHPTRKGFTFHRGRYASRIDYFMLSNHLAGLVESIKAETLAHSDHNLLAISLKTSKITRGPGLWRFDTSLLGKEDFITKMTEFLTEWTPPRGTVRALVYMGVVEV